MVALPPDRNPARVSGASRPRSSPDAPLPGPLTSLVGREREVAAVGGLLSQPAVRLVTLTGPGGVGKTRLALRVAETVGDDFPDGLWFVPLAAVRDPSFLPSTIAQALGVREAGHRSPTEGIVAFLRERHGLLILDNFEHLLASAPLVADLLARCPLLTCLVTSRAVLRISGEHAFPVPLLPLPPTAATITAERAVMSPAIRLFVSRAQAAQPDFDLTDANAGPVDAICRRLEGLPLAIELAAAKVRHLTLGEVANRLAANDGGTARHVLAGGPRDAPDRQQSLRDTFTWSYGLLSDEERALFRRLAVFVGGFTLEAAIAVAHLDSDDDSAGDVAEGVGALVDQSLLQRTEGAGNASRYGMMETVREFGLEQLSASGEEPAARERHAEWTLVFAEHAGSWVLEPDAPHWLTALERDHANLRAALSWLVERQDGERLGRLAGALWVFWEERAHYAEGRHWLELALDLGAATPASVRLSLLFGAGTMARHQAEFSKGIVRHQQALTLAQALGDRTAEATALHNLGAQALDVGDFDDARERFEASIAIAREAGTPRQVIRTLNALGQMQRARNDSVTAMRTLEGVLALAREHHQDWLLISILGGLGLTATDLGDVDRALAWLRESLSLAVAKGDLGGVIDGIEGLARLAAVTGQADQALRLFGAGEALREKLTFPLSPTEIAYAEPIMTSLRERLGPAGFAAAWAAGRLLTQDEGLDEALAVRATAAVTELPGATEPSEPHGLTGRELDVLRLLVAGKVDREIAATLFISRRTASKHVSAILAKLHVASRAEAAVLAIQRGLV